MPPPRGTFTTRGGVWLGMMNASAPLARLTVDAEKLRINGAIVGNYTFTADDIVSMTRFSIVPLLMWGIKIEHANLKYPKRFIFWSIKPPEFVLDGIAATGFQPKAPPSALQAFEKRRGLPVRWQAILALLLLWNVPLILMLISPMMLLFTMLAFFVGSLAALYSPRMQRLLLKPGRHFEEIQMIVRILPVIFGLMLVVWTVLFAVSPDLRKSMLDANEPFRPNNPTTEQNRQ
jgi:hypothetical protein